MTSNNVKKKLKSMHQFYSEDILKDEQEEKQTSKRIIFEYLLDK